MNPKPPKKVWKILVADGLFFMVDEHDVTVWPASMGQSRHKMFEYAIDHGADEVEHAYDNVKHGS
jgi:hypothetical protein